MESATTSPHIKDHYKVVGVVPGVVQARDGKMVDLRTISLERAHELFAQKFPFLQKVEASADLPIVEEITASVNEVEGAETKVEEKVEDPAVEKRTPSNKNFNGHRTGKR